MQILGSTELRGDVHERDLCVNCGACVGHCPYFKSYKGKVAMLFPCSMQQGRCHAFCPKTEVDFDALSQMRFGLPYDGSPLGHYRRVYKARAGVKTLEKGAYQYGGTGSSLVAYAMNAGIIDGAALTRCDGLIPKPELATTKEEIFACASSKYMASHTLAAVNSDKAKELKKLGVVGTPCHIIASSQMQANVLSRDDVPPIALTIGLFCTWALDTRRLSSLLDGRTAGAEITSMDVPPPPATAMHFETTEGRVEIPLSEIRTCIPEGCSICPDMTAEFADLSIGALEGDATWNTLIVRTEKGQRLVDDAVKAGYLETADYPAQSLENLKRGAAGKKQRAFSKAKGENLLNNTEEGQRSAMHVPESALEAKGVRI